MNQKRKQKRFKTSSKKKDTRMKYIEVPEPVTLITLNDIEMKNEDQEPATTSLREFIIGRMMDVKFLGAKKGVEGAIFLMECKQEVEKQLGKKDDEKNPEILSLENETWKSLVESMKDPTGGYDSRYIHCLVPLMKPIMDATDKHPQEIAEEEKKKEEEEKDGGKEEETAE